MNKPRCVDDFTITCQMNVTPLVVDNFVLQSTTMDKYHLYRHDRLLDLSMDLKPLEIFRYAQDDVPRALR